MENTRIDMAQGVIEKHLGSPGRMIAGSKSGYRKAFPGNAAVFNANIIVEGQKVWYGDIDITLSADELRKIASELDKNVYVLPEYAARFENEETPQMTETMVMFMPDGDFLFGQNWSNYLEIVDGTIKFSQAK